MSACQECGAEVHGQAKRCMGCHWAARPVVAWAYRLVKQAIKSGELADLKQAHVACADCGGRAVLWEHRDYLKPVDVEPVCKPCNVRRGPAVPCLPRLTGRLAVMSEQGRIGQQKAYQEAQQFIAKRAAEIAQERVAA